MNKRRNYTLLPITVNHYTNITLNYAIVSLVGYIEFPLPILKNSHLNLPVASKLH